MERTRRLLDEIAGWRAESPSHDRFARELVRLVRLIADSFEGEQRDELLAEAEVSFLRQCEVHARIQNASATLEKVLGLQRKLLDQLASMTKSRPPDATLH